MRWTEAASFFRFVISSHRTSQLQSTAKVLEKASHRHETCLPDLFSDSWSEPCRVDVFTVRGSGRLILASNRTENGFRSIVGAGFDISAGGRACIRTRWRARRTNSAAYAGYVGSLSAAATDELRSRAAGQIQRQRHRERIRAVSEQSRGGQQS